MKQTINFNQFCDAFSDTYKNNFSYEGKKSLFEYLERFEEELNEEIELDTVAICCDYTEYDNFEDLKESYPDIKDIEELKNNTCVIEVEGTDKIIIQNF